MFIQKEFSFVSSQTLLKYIKKQGKIIYFKNRDIKLQIFWPISKFLIIIFFNNVYILIRLEKEFILCVINYLGMF